MLILNSQARYDADVPQSMSHDAIIRPGGSPPLIFPECAKCGKPVEWFTVDAMRDPYNVCVDARCHGKQQGARFTAAEIHYKRKNNQPVLMFKE